MNTAIIQVLKPNVSQEDAVRAFSARGFSRAYWNLRNGPLRRIASAYVPFSVYRVRYAMNRASEDRLFALDAVDGSLDLFSFARVPPARNCAPSKLAIFSSLRSPKPKAPACSATKCSA